MNTQPSERYNWELESVQIRFREVYGIELSSEQARRIFLFEQGKGPFSGEYYLSTWEEWDYELWAFKKILTPEQFPHFQQKLNDSIEHYKRDLVEHGKKSANDIEYYQKLMLYYEEEFLPDFFNDPILSSFSWLSNEKPKIEFLKAEYKKYLDNTRLKIITEHFRHNRNFNPMVLEAELLRHKEYCIWPFYCAFKTGMDEPTKVIAEYLEKKLTHFIDKYDEFILRKVERLRAFEKECFDRYYGEYRGGWQITIQGQLAPEEERQVRAMSLLLLDNERYGY